MDKNIVVVVIFRRPLRQATLGAACRHHHPVWQHQSHFSFFSVSRVDGGQLKILLDDL
jgi:hypothetical protein